eukprot:COSAG03_NODE_6458_length_1057_cov_1.272443_3_plen_30_part_01
MMRESPVSEDDLERERERETGPPAAPLSPG